MPTVKIAFLDTIDWDYSPLTPYERPLGGSQSALCYLSAAMAADGHDVALVNNIGRPGVYAGVTCPGREAGMAADFLNGFDAVIVLNVAQGRHLRQRGVATRLVLWAQHATDQPDVASLKDPGEREAWDAFAMVTEWQGAAYVRDLGVDQERIVIMRNAVAPMFESLARKRPPFFIRGEAPLLVYTSTPFRGLDILLMAFPMIRALVPGCRLKVYSSLQIYGVAPEKDEFRILYELARAIDGVEYVGSISQRRLADALSEADILAYPNTFPEMACIAVMEAMAAGCLVLTSKLGALPETSAGFGFLMDPASDVMGFADNFIRMTTGVATAARDDPEKFHAHIGRQTAFVRDTYTWQARAREVARWAARLPSRPRPGGSG